MKAERERERENCSGQMRKITSKKKYADEYLSLVNDSGYNWPYIAYGHGVFERTTFREYERRPLIGLRKNTCVHLPICIAFC